MTTHTVTWRTVSGARTAVCSCGRTASWATDELTLDHLHPPRAVCPTCGYDRPVPRKDTDRV